MVEKSDSTSAEELRTTFLGMLAYDVLVVAERLEIDDNQTSRCDFIRTLFAAIEGSVWQFREHVRSIAADLDKLPPILAMAFAETSYSVTEAGKLIEQQRFIPLQTMIRFATNIAKELTPELEIDFSGSGWADLKQTIAIRNRITHPKGISDLTVSSEDTKTAWSGLIWLLDHVARTMEATSAVYADDLKELKVLVAELKAGDPIALEAYRKAFALVHE
jgi:hypothetical protein